MEITFIPYSMRRVIFQNRFNRDLKRMLKRGKNRADLLIIIEILAQGMPLPDSCRPHKLSGEYEGLWECHIESNWLLIYDIIDANIIIARTGTHEDLFG